MSARSTFALLAALLLVPAISTAGQSASRRAACDRSCLTGILTSYLAALTAHDPSKVAAAPGLRVTEDTVEMKLGGRPVEDDLILLRAVLPAVRGYRSLNSDRVSSRRAFSSPQRLLASTCPELQTMCNAALFSDPTSARCP